MEKRYQVFVSSTFEDLREERSAVISALLQIDCFPAGMELFPAADDDSFTLIKSVIDDSDYYLIILGGRYGTLEAASGKSYTHLEYEYALSKGKPTIALLHVNPGSLAADKTERSDENRKHFDDFRAELKKKNCRYWSDRGELTTAVFTGIQHLKKTRPGLGWIRSAGASDEEVKDELLRLRREIDSLNSELAEARCRSVPAGAEELAQGADQTSIYIEFPERGDFEAFNCTWEEVIRSVLPQTFGPGADNRAIASALASLARESDHDITVPPVCWQDPVVPRSSFGKVINQMVALGLLIGRSHPGNPAETLWQATPYGVQEGSRLVALRRTP